jgi:hypothetical protein
MQEIFLPVKVVRYWQENGHLKFEMALKSIDFIPFKNVLRLIDSLVRQSRTISDNQHGAEIRSTVALTGSHPPGIQKKQRSVSPVCWCPVYVERVWHPPCNPQNRKHLSSFSDSRSISYSDCIPTALRMSTEITFHRSTAC